MIIKSLLLEKCNFHYRWYCQYDLPFTNFLSYLYNWHLSYHSRRKDLVNFNFNLKFHFSNFRVFIVNFIAVRVVATAINKVKAVNISQLGHFHCNCILDLLLANIYYYAWNYYSLRSLILACLLKETSRLVVVCYQDISRR